MSTSETADESGADPGASTPRRRRTFARFLLVGCANASIDTGVYLALRFVGLDLVLANLISTTCGLIFSFFANRSFTFDARRSTRKAALTQAGTFLVVVGVGLWVIQPLVISAVSWVLSQWFELPRWATDLLSKVAAIGVALVWNYVLFRLVVFTERQDSNPEAPQT